MKDPKRPMRRIASVEEEPQETPQILSPEEKRELILAHARSQTGKDPMQRMTVWGGVMIAMAGIAVGWWWTVGSSLQQHASNGFPELRTVTKNLDDFTKTIQQESNAVKQPLSPTNSANASEYSGIMKALIEGNNQKAKRDDLLAPQPNGSVKATSSSDAAIENHPTSTSASPADFINPATPGLTPDQSSN